MSATVWLTPATLSAAMDEGAFGSEEFRGGAADAGRCAGDDGRICQ